MNRIKFFIVILTILIFIAPQSIKGESKSGEDLQSTHYVAQENFTPKKTMDNFSTFGQVRVNVTIEGTASIDGQGNVPLKIDRKGNTLTITPL